jgi:hypothetical protein
MKKFVFLHCGFETPTKEIQEAWMKWFASVGSRIVDSGSPMAAGKEVTRSRVKDLSRGKDAITGYMIISAESMDDALRVAQASPFITSMRVYEAMSM